MAKFIGLTNAADGNPVYVNVDQILFLQVRDAKMHPAITILSFCDGLKLSIAAAPKDVIAAIEKVK
jgi:hypothetical protein